MKESKKPAKATSNGRFYSLEITAEGLSNIKNGFPEEQLIKRIGNGSVRLSNEISPIALGWAKRNSWINIKDNTVRLSEQGLSALKSDYGKSSLLTKLKEAGDRAALGKLIESNTQAVKELERRGLIKIKERVLLPEANIPAKTPARPAGVFAGHGQLTREMIKKWPREKPEFRVYDVNTPVRQAHPARLHPMHKFIDSIRAIWISMGFTEVKGPIIEPAFWNFDALFSPQDHPTRDMQDTFFLSNPRQLDIEDAQLLKGVKEMHETGWKERWNEEIAKQALLRTHATSVSVRHINKFGNEDEEKYPMKLFSIGKVFRNETPDYKHLAELFQIDGIIIGNALTLANLIHILKEFYNSIGINAQIRPSYFPFVEPGLEVYYYDDKLKDNIELCGAGVIRKEITKAMGTNKTVLAFGGGLDRLMFNYISLNYLGELYRNNVGWLRSVGEVIPL